MVVHWLFTGYSQNSQYFLNILPNSLDCYSSHFNKKVIFADFNLKWIAQSCKFLQMTLNIGHITA